MTDPRLPKKGSHYTNWKEPIERCQFCPFYRYHVSEIQERCHAREHGGGRMLTAEGLQRPPKWCRLRVEGPITLRVKED